MVEKGYRIEMGEEDLARFAGSRHLGMAGDRMEFPGLRVVSSVEKETDYGVVTVLTFEDKKGNVLVWFASGSKKYARGDVANLKATVKGYDESDGVRKTVVTRAAELEEKQKWKACALATARGRR
jgi:hypothetical protein